MRRVKKRITFFVVFLIPVVWYLFLQLFGSNNFSLELLEPLDNCSQGPELKILRRDLSLSLAKQNYLDRVQYGAESRKIEVAVFDESFDDCTNQNLLDLVLVDERGLWGTYDLSRDGVERLLTELDILVLQKQYGKGSYR